MFPGSDESTSRDLLDALSQTRVDEVRAANDRLILVAEYLADRPPRGPDDVAMDEDPCLLGDRSIPIAGEGAPPVSEFAVMSLGSERAWEPRAAWRPTWSR